MEQIKFREEKIEPRGFDEIPEVRCFKCGNTEPDELEPIHKDIGTDYICFNCGDKLDAMFNLF